MTIDPVALLKRYHEALNAYDEMKVKQMFSLRAIYVSSGVDGRIEGRDAIVAAFSAYFAEHPDQHAGDDEITQLAPLQARAVWRLKSTAKSTGRRIARRGVETVTFDAAGLILAVDVEDQ